MCVYLSIRLSISVFQIKNNSEGQAEARGRKGNEGFCIQDAGPIKELASISN